MGTRPAEDCSRAAAWGPRPYSGIQVLRRQVAPVCLGVYTEARGRRSHVTLSGPSIRLGGSDLRSRTGYSTI
jgi:hypothetical protein